MLLGGMETLILSVQIEHVAFLGFRCGWSVRCLVLGLSSFIRRVRKIAKSDY